MLDEAKLIDWSQLIDSEKAGFAASGERFRPHGVTGAHRTLPFGTMLRVSYSGRSVDVGVNERGTAVWTGLDLSREAARQLGLLLPV